MGIDPPTSGKKSFVSEKVDFESKTPSCTARKTKHTHNAVFCHNSLFKLLEPVLFYTAVDVSILCTVFLIQEVHGLT
jgi:hypothetical protein